MSEGNSESTEGSKALNDSPGPEVLALLVEGHRTELSRHEVVAHGVVGGLLVSYLRWKIGEKGPMASPPSEYGILGASAAKEGESLGTWADEGFCLMVHLGEGAGEAPRVCAMSEMKYEPRVRALRGRDIESSK